ncbi:2-dehydropantoate 2-reductase [Streptomyces malaysiensis]|uniref:2-dehydropantoate 2-reductase n=1 Tax=Streptomyces malaysiensis subsp. samsunensis TaxID=459658 RepID=A0A9X2M5Y5_STRMQ|nr:2-dehydropantoate 2-reductase [Streptomyces samsunensis]MCQ8836058.1 2-dehydropantoate 2-reductase [Streptomyces samsunensis]
MLSTPGRDPVAVVGPGAVGLALAARLAGQGHPVTLCGRPGTAPVSAVTSSDEHGMRTVDVEWRSEPARVHLFRWVVVATKLHQGDAARAWLERLVDSDTLVVVAQNGIEHRELVAPHVPRHQVVPALVHFNAERHDRDRVEIRQDGPGLVIGDDGPGRRARPLLDRTGLGVRIVTDFTTAAWRKLMVNAVANPLTALTCRRVEVFADPSVRNLAVTMLAEVAAVGRAEGARLPAEAVEDVLAWIDARPAGAGSSMLADRLAGRRLEYDGLLGAVVRRARTHALAAPVCTAVLALVAALDTAPSTRAAAHDTFKNQEQQ